MNVHVLLQGSNRPAPRNAKRIGNVEHNERVEVIVTLRGPKLPDVSTVAKKALSRRQLATQYGAKAADADMVARVLKNYGLTVENISPGGRGMRVSGSIAQMEAAFKAKLGVYRSVAQGDFRGREGELRIPAELNGIVTGVFGLDERRVAQRKLPVAAARRVLAKAPAKGKAPRKTKGPQPLGPADFEARYNFPPGTAKGQQIGIAEIGGGYFRNDLKAYCSKFGRPVPKVTTVSVGLNPLTLKQINKLPKKRRNRELLATTEVMMDVQGVAGLCPAAEIFVYFTPFTQKGWVDLMDTVISGNPAKPVTLSISYGLPEDDSDWSQAARDVINDRLHAAALLGITVCIASGDDGSGDGMTDGRSHVDFPSSSPFVLSVGGTMLTGTKATVREVAWWESPGTRAGSGGATGGGVSLFFRRPRWQSVHIRSLNSGSIDGRVTPDVSALAGPPLYDLILFGVDRPNGGTSASAPLWAALIARINANLPIKKRQRFLTPLLYRKLPGGKTVGQSALRDITEGQNASHPKPGVGYRAKKGYDAVTGWGSPNGKELLIKLS
jgi:kumamolisin